METFAGIRWQGVKTPLDALFYPSIDFGVGGAEGRITLLVRGSPSFLLRFKGVEAISGFSETVYWSLAAEPSRPTHILNRVVGSLLLERLRALRDTGDLELFLICGGNMCCEAVAYGSYSLTEYASEELAEAAAVSEITSIGTTSENVLKWRSADEPWG